MHTFRDKKGAQWDIEVGLAQLAAVKSRVGLDLTHLVTADQSSTIAELADPAKLFDVLLTLTEAQRLERGVSPEDFGAALNDADLVEAAMEAVINGTIDFFPNRSRTALRTAFATVKKVGTEIRAKALDRLETLVADPKLAQRLTSTLSKSAGGSQESSGLTPGGSVGDSST